MIKYLGEREERGLLLVDEEVSIVVANVVVKQREAEKCDNNHLDNESVQYEDI